MQFQRNDKKRSAQPASEGRPAKDLQPTKKHPQRHCPGLLLANPAHAGKRARWGQGDTGTRDHPRMCGEKFSRLALRSSWMGSSPHMRGKGVVGVGKAPPGGITPACAGKSPPIPANCPCRWDHPRMCEEKAFVESGIACGRGSPPHVRGKVVVPLMSLVGVGITPACAGKRAAANFHPGTTRDHPRTCGEK